MDHATLPAGGRCCAAGAEDLAANWPPERACAIRSVVQYPEADANPEATIAGAVLTCAASAVSVPAVGVVAVPERASGW